MTNKIKIYTKILEFFLLCEAPNILLNFRFLVIPDPYIAGYPLVEPVGYVWLLDHVRNTLQVVLDDQKLVDKDHRKSLSDHPIRYLFAGPADQLEV